MAYDRNSIKDFVGAVEDELAEFVGYEFCAARLIAYIEMTRAIGVVDGQKAKDLLGDAYHLKKLADIGRKNTGWVRRPPAELQMMAMTEVGRE